MARLTVLQWQYMGQLFTELDSKPATSSLLPISISLGVSALIFLVSFSVVFVLPPEIPLWYSTQQTTTVLAQKWWLFIFPLIALSGSLFMLLINSVKKLDSTVMMVIGWLNCIWTVVILAVETRLLFLML